MPATNIQELPLISFLQAKHVRQACTLNHQSLKRVDGKEEGAIIKKLGSGTDSTEISPEVASNGVGLVEGDQKWQSSQPKGGMQNSEELQMVGIDDQCGNNPDYQQSSPYGPGSSESLFQLVDTSYPQDQLMTSFPQSVLPFQQDRLSPPRDPDTRLPFAPGGPS